jgi:hypothetical protein
MMLAHLQIPPTNPRTYVNTLPASTVDALLKALAKEPEERFSSAGEFVQVL